jgi:hypothetical protein
MDGSTAGTEDRDGDVPRRLNTRVAGPAVAAGAVSLGLVLIGACGLRQQDVYVAPPPLNMDLQAAPVAVQASTTTPGVVIPPSPSWRMADHLPILHTTTSASDTPTTATAGQGVPADDPGAPPPPPTTTRSAPAAADPSTDDLETTMTPTTRPTRPATTHPVPTTMRSPASDGDGN